MEIAMKVEPYVTFNGRCDEAIEFYKTTLGAKVNMLTRFKDCPEPMPGMDSALGDKVMHANVTIGDSVVLMSDGRCKGDASFKGFSLAISVPSDADAKRVFEALAEGGKIGMPLGKTFFSSSFGMVADRFGMGWMVLVAN
jgi:PhnB protein